MTRGRSRLIYFTSGVAVTALTLVVLMAVGVLPVRTRTTTVVTRQPAATGTTETSTAPSSGALTPAQIYQKDSSGVVEVVSTLQTTTQGFFGPVSGQSQALGSGFVVSKQGYVLTNAHVVSSDGQAASKVSVVFKGRGSQTTTVAARIVGIDETSDVAVLKVDPANAPALDPLVLGDSSAAQVGEPVVAIGNPLQLEFTLTSGIVSAIHRDLSPQSGTNIFNGIQTDAAINPGNSGGPLIDASGNVIGINESIESTTGGNQGLGFAVPIDTAKNSLGQIVRTGHVAYPWMGVTLQTMTPDLAKTLHYNVSEGALVAAVKAGSPAARAGIKAGTSTVTVQGQSFTVGGVVITAVNGKPVATASDLVQAVGAFKPGDTITLTTVDRQGASATVKIKLATRPANL